MIVVHGTRAFRDRVPGPAGAPGAVSTSMLGSSSATLLRWRSPVATFVNESTLFPVLLPLAPAAALLARLRDAITDALKQSRVPGRLIEAERAAASDIVLAPTADRSMTGIMVEFARLADVHRAHGDDLPQIAARLAATPCSPLYKRHVSPDREFAALVRDLPDQ